ncbi:MAG: hypothetical protein DYG94_08950 [Leptolyngbya sp. PLA3]|nr:MAG: hypothetical protein EDM82_02845 [Cyanobacteria bacterium CYA]MCE7968858.1 hypothetical protein [Leptolyngbya sp. PL-A3]
MFIEHISNAGALPALRAMISFAAERQKLIAHNIANFETPNFQPVDVSPQAFQAALADAIEQRRALNGGTHGAVSVGRGDEFEQGADGSLVLRPRTPMAGVLAHDRNSSDLERTMQSLVENAATFRVATDLYRARMGVMKKAIGERVG